MTAPKIRAVLFDFGGVVLTSPFDAFAEYERAEGFPVGLIREINSTNPDDNAWARLERSDVDTAGFIQLFEQEANDRGHAVSGAKVLELISGDVRPEMVEAIVRVKRAGYLTACLTNNVKRSADDRSGDRKRDAAVAEVMAMFDHVVESSVIGVRKPEIGFYRTALKIVGVEPTEAVFLDDLGINLKPARAMGITTIKVIDADGALTQLEAILGLDLRG